MMEIKAKKLEEACLDEMYKASTPPISWKEVVQKYSKTGIQFFSKHKILEKEYDRIKAKYAKKLGKRWKKDLDWMLLDFAPTCKASD